MLQLPAEGMRLVPEPTMTTSDDMATVQLRDFMFSAEGWGREQGRQVYNKLLTFIEHHPGQLIFQISLSRVARVDISFASETVVELARRYRGNKGFFFADLTDVDMMENWDAAADKKNQPLSSWSGSTCRLLGSKPTQGSVEAFLFALKRRRVRATEFIKEFPTISIANASMKFKQLWEQGFLLRREVVAESGGVEFEYLRIGPPNIAFERLR